MTYAAAAITALTAVLGVTIVWMAVIALRAWRRSRGVRLVTCPETATVAAVRLNRRQAIVAALWNSMRGEQLADCSRWPVRGRCEELCVPQAQAADSELKRMITQWSADRRCGLCDKPLVEESLVGHHITLRLSDGVTTEWPDMAPETVPDRLQTCLPVCWSCHVAETLRRQHPELVVDR